MMTHKPCATTTSKRYFIRTFFFLLFALDTICVTSAASSSSSTRTERGLRLEAPRFGGGPSIPNPIAAINRAFFPVIQATTPNSLNTSVSFTVPLFSLSTNARDFDLTSLGIPKGSSNLLVLLSISTVVIGLAVIFLPLLPAALGIIQQPVTGRANDGFSSFMTNGISDFLYTVADNPLAGLPGLDPGECFKRCICEANNRPTRYGWIAFPFQLFFPPYSGNQRDDDPSSLSQYQLAARYGKSDNANCAMQYNGCLFNPLDMLKKIIDWFFSKKKRK